MSHPDQHPTASKVRRPYAPPRVSSRSVRAEPVFQAGCGIGIDFGKFRKPKR
jgi:hypothetical protein